MIRMGTLLINRNCVTHHTVMSLLITYLPELSRFPNLRTCLCISSPNTPVLIFLVLEIRFKPLQFRKAVILDYNYFHSFSFGAGAYEV